MNIKIIAIIVVAAVVVAGGAAAFFLLSPNGEKDREINILAAVNEEGSGLYIKSDVDLETMFDFSTPIPTALREGWGGKVFGTPGPTSIQHTQLMTIVKGLDLKFTLYQAGGTISSDTVYFDSGVSNAALALANGHIDGGIIWQPQYEKIIADSSNKFKELALTNDLFPEHACCVLAGVHSYVSSHQDETVRLLVAYIQATRWVNDAMNDINGSDYQRLVTIAKNLAGPNFSEEEIKQALATVTYTYGGSNSDPLSDLKGDIVTLVDNLTSIDSNLSKNFDKLGFSSKAAFADSLVDDEYLLRALDIISGNSEMGSHGSLTDITVAVISGDIHQIAIHVAKELGYFEEYGLNVSFSLGVNGAGVATALQNGNASFGLLGAPPLTITVINSELIKG